MRSFKAEIAVDMHRYLIKDAYTILELSVILIITCFLLSMGISTINSFNIIKKQLDTKRKLIQIEGSLISYFRKYKKLPCPITFKISTEEYAKSDDISSDLAIGCGNDIMHHSNIYIGSVPFVELGLDKSFLYDSWGNKIIFAVDKNFVLTLLPGQISKLFYQFLPTIKIKNSTSTIITNNAIYALLSHGKNQHGSYDIYGNKHNDSGNSLETENSNMDDVLIYIYQRQRNISNDGIIYDDFLRFKTKLQLLVDSGIKYDVPYVDRGDNLVVGRNFAMRECLCDDVLLKNVKTLLYSR